MSQSRFFCGILICIFKIFFAASHVWRHIFIIYCCKMYQCLPNNAFEAAHSHSLSCSFPESLVKPELKGRLLSSIDSIHITTLSTTTTTTTTVQVEQYHYPWHRHQ